MKRRAALALAFACAALVSACSSDDAPEPEPTLETPGAFVAVKEDTGSMTLLRTLDTLTLQDETVLFITIYDVDPSGFADARELAKRHDLPLRVEIQFKSEGPIVSRPYRVVWFRSLTDEEKERVP